MCNKVVRVLSLVFLFAFLVSPVRAAVVINEFSSGSSSDWVELYNTATESADLSQYRLEDSTGSLKDPIDGSLTGLGFLSVSVSNRLNNAGDKIKLFHIGNSIPVDEISYGDHGGLCAPAEGQSMGSKPDGSGDIVLFASVSEGASNNSTSTTSCPAPTPTRTPTPTNQPATPTPTRTPTPVKSPTPKPTNSPVPTEKQPTPIPISDGDTPGESGDDGSQDGTNGQVQGIVLVASQKKDMRPIIISLIITAAGCAILAGFFIWKKIQLKKMTSQQSL